MCLVMDFYSMFLWLASFIKFIPKAKALINKNVIVNILISYLLIVTIFFFKYEVRALYKVLEISKIPTCHFLYNNSLFIIIQV